ncbi:MAG: stalk domain-containing protein [Pseudomonadota bacterium]
MTAVSIPRRKLLKSISFLLLTTLMFTVTCVYGEVSTPTTISASDIEAQIRIPAPSVLYAQKSSPLDYWMELFMEENPESWQDPTFYDAATDNDTAFVAVGDYFGKAASYSKDGKAWKTTATPFNESRSIAFGYGRFAAAAGDIYTSGDGVEWKKVEGLKGDYSIIKYGNGFFFALGKTDIGWDKAYVAAVSTNGISWTENPVLGQTNRLIQDVFVVKDSFWVPVGEFVYTTVDGKSFVRIVCPVADNYSIGEALYGNGTYIIELAGDIYTSKDMVSWQLSEAIPNLADMTYGGNMFIALCNDYDKYRNLVYTSKDGKKWTLESELGYGWFNKILYARDRLYLFGYPNEVLCSAPLIPPEDPELIQATVSNGKVKLMWNSPNDTSAIFGVYRSTSRDSGYLMAGTVDNGIYFTDEGLEPGTYYYKVKAANVYGSSNFSNIESVTIGGGGLLLIKPTLRIVMSAPNDLEGSADSPYEISLSWEDNNQGEKGHKILRSLESGDYKVVGMTGADETSYTDAGLLPDTTYKYKVCAYNDLADSAYSEEIEVTTERRTGVLERMSKEDFGKLLDRIREQKELTPTPELTPGPTPTPTPVQEHDNGTTAPVATGGSIKAPAVVVKLTIGNDDYTVDGKASQMDTAPILKDDRTLVPFRYIAQAIGAQVGWDASQRKVTVTLKDNVVELWIGKNKAMVNGREVQIDAKNSNVAPVIVPPGRTMTPLRFIAESLGCEVKYDPVTKGIEIIYTK